MTTEDDLRRVGEAADIMHRRRSTDATMCVVVERTDTWLFIVPAFVAGFLCDWLVRWMVG